MAICNAICKEEAAKKNKVSFTESEEQEH